MPFGSWQHHLHDHKRPSTLNTFSRQGGSTLDFCKTQGMGDLKRTGLPKALTCRRQQRPSSRQLHPAPAAAAQPLPGSPREGGKLALRHWTMLQLCLLLLAHPHCPASPQDLHSAEYLPHPGVLSAVKLQPDNADKQLSNEECDAHRVPHRPHSLMSMNLV